MPPKRIQSQFNSSSENQPMVEDSDDETSNDLNECVVVTKGGHNDTLRKLVREKGKLPITFNKCDGRPTGPHSIVFTIESGLVVQAYAPLQVLEWKNITKEQKQSMFDRLHNSFDVDFGTGPNSVRKITDVWMGDRYRNNRSKMFNHYKKNCAHLPREMRLEMLPARFHGDPHDWAYLCSLFESEKFKARSEKNAANRVKLQVNHRGGSKSFVRHSYKTGDGPKEVNRIDLYKKTRWNEKHSWADGAHEIHEKMVSRFNEIKEVVEPFDDESATISDVEIAERVCDEILGTRSGYIPGLGHGPKPSKFLSDYNRSTNAELKGQLKSTQDELENTRTSLQSAHHEIKSLKQNMEVFGQLFEKIAPGEYQTLIGKMNPDSTSL